MRAEEKNMVERIMDTETMDMPMSIHMVGEPEKNICWH